MQRLLPILSLTIATSVLSASPALAEQKKSPLAGQPQIRHKLEMRKNRLELAPQLVFSINQDFRHFIGGGIAVQYHITDWLGLAVSFAGGAGLDSGLTSNIDGQLVKEGSGMSPQQFQPTREQFRAHLGTTNMLLGVYGTLTPFAGKLAMFGAAYARYDLYAIVGFGLMNITNTWDSYNNPNKQASNSPACSDPKAMVGADPNLCDPANGGFKPSGNFGVGLHVYFNEWLGLNLELRDYLNATNMGGLDVNGDRKLNSDDQTISNNLFVGVGLSVMIPIHAKVSP